MEFKVGNRSFLLNGKPFFVLSGEIHYFRLERNLWEKHLLELKKANLNTVSTYVPWDWHETEEGIFDFDGKTSPEKDLNGFLNLAEKLGLLVILKPGPYIIAEYYNCGLPVWLTKKHRDILAIGSDGRKWEEFIATLINPKYLYYVNRWFDHILPLIKENSFSNKKNIIMLQVCNESGVFQWLDKKYDHSPFVKVRYQQFIKSNYKKRMLMSGEASNKKINFKTVDFPREMSVNDTSAMREQIEWHEFWRLYYAEYLGNLKKKIQSLNIKLPLFHNVPGWNLSRALEYPVNETMYRHVACKSNDFLLAVDHIPENLNYRNNHDAPIVNKLNRSIQGMNKPLYVAEMQAGTREYHVKPSSKELANFYRLCLMDGLSGMNFYMFSSGINPSGRGMTGREFYWHTPLDEKAKINNNSYSEIRNLGSMLKIFGPSISKSKQKSKVAIAFYPSYYQTELMPEVKCFAYDFKKVRDMCFFDGLLKYLTNANIDFDILDLSHPEPRIWNKYKQIWIMSFEWMDAIAQNEILNFIRSGGHAVLFPCLPKFNLQMEDCNLLQTCLKIIIKGTVNLGIPQISVGNVSQLPCMNPITIFDGGKTEIARTVDGQCCGVRVELEKGVATVFGTAFPYYNPDHAKVYNQLFSTDKINPSAYSSNPNITVRQVWGKGYGFLFVSNVHEDSQKGSIFYTGIKSGVPEKLTSQMELGSKEGYILPLDYKIGFVRICYITAEIIDSKIKSNLVLIQIRGKKGETFRMAFYSARRPVRITLNQKSIPFTKLNGKTYVEFRLDNEESEINFIRLG